MTEKILNLVGDFLKKNNIEGLDLKKMVANLPIDEIMSMLEGKDKYVIKKSGSLEKYQEDKIGRSITNAAERSDMPLNTSDLALILKEITGRLFGPNDKVGVHKTSDIKDIVVSALKATGFSKISEVYDAYAKAQD